MKGKKRRIWFVCLKSHFIDLSNLSRQWYRRFDTFVISNGFTRSSYDSGVHYKKENLDCYTYILLYANDMLVASPSLEAINSLKRPLSSEFDMNDLRAAKRILQEI